MIKQIIPRNFLSFGPDCPGIELEGLNVLIGPNGSGKSNLIEAIHFMRSSSSGIAEVTRKGGGAQYYLWSENHSDWAKVVCVHSDENEGLAHYIAFSANQQRFEIREESIYPLGQPEEWFFLKSPGIAVQARTVAGETIIYDNYENYRSVLDQLRDPATYPKISALASSYSKVRIYRDWNFGRKNPVRDPQPSDMPNSFLAEDCSNLGLFLSYLKAHHPKAKRIFLEHLKLLYEGITDFEISTAGGTVQIFLQEGDRSIPATRLSDGTLRYLCILAILCDPAPPSLVCLEEPELGLHPDLFPKLADLIKEFSQNTQVVISTHSDILVDCFTEVASAVVVCSKLNGQTEMQRLDPESLRKWLDSYRLGQLWTMGQIGGTRW